MNKNTIYLVTGAAGYLGSNVCRQLAARGCQVRALTLPNDPAAKFIPEEAQNSSSEQFGTDRMLKVLNANRDETPAGLLAAVAKAIDEFQGDAGQFDDMTMLCFFCDKRSDIKDTDNLIIGNDITEELQMKL